MLILRLVSFTVSSYCKLVTGVPDIIEVEVILALAFALELKVILSPVINPPSVTVTIIFE